MPKPDTDTKTKVYNLYIELLAAVKDKKETVKVHNENIKRINTEIMEVLEEEEDGVRNSQKSAD